MKPKNSYIVCLLDLENHRIQKGIFFVKTILSIEEVADKFGLSPRLKQLMALRWTVHISKVAAGDKRIEQAADLVAPAFDDNIVAILRKIMTKLESQPTSKTIILPANTPMEPL